MLDKVKPSFKRNLTHLVLNYEKHLSKKLSESIKISLFNEMNNELLDSILKIHYDSFHYLDNSNFESYYKSLFFNDPNLSIFLVENNKPLGFIINGSKKTYIKTTDYYTDRVAVIKEKHNNGIAPILINLSTTVAKGLNYKFHGLIPTLKNKAIDLLEYYKKKGFYIDNNLSDSVSVYMRRNANKYSLI
jgi:hypothetical protein